MTKLRITLVKSPNGYQQDQRDTVKALGLRRLRHTIEREDSPTLRGMLHKVAHLVKAEEA
ncbi:MAG: ribosomal protein [Dehalococcoidia bacterium]|nr:ribosomal protein [Dehalococcoidia bacterium]